jgi:hypothetical protein
VQREGNFLGQRNSLISSEQVFWTLWSDSVIAERFVGEDRNGSAIVRSCRSGLTRLCAYVEAQFAVENREGVILAEVRSGTSASARKLLAMSPHGENSHLKPPHHQGERSYTEIDDDDDPLDQPHIIMSDSQVTLRTRKFIRNPLLGRKQMVVCVQPLQQPAK